MGDIEGLVVRVQAGDEDAYEDIVHRFQDMAVGYGYTLLGDVHQAEDAAQEAFIEAYLQIENLRDPKAFPGWFRKIVFKQCDRLRRDKRTTSVSLEKAAALTAPDAGPAEIAERREAGAMVVDAIAALPDAHRAAITLFSIGEYSYREVAAFLGIPVSTVKNRLHSARSRLRDGTLAAFRDELRAHRPSDRNTLAARVLHMLKIAPTQEEHGPDVYAVINAQWPAIELTTDPGRISDSHYDWATTRIGMVDGRATTHFGVYDLAMRIGSARLRTAGVQLVTTLADYRGEGLMLETAQASLAAMRANGYDLSVVLRTHDDRLYKQLGYVFAWPETSFEIATRDLPDGPIQAEVIEFTPGYRPELAEIYNRENDRVTGTAVRPTYRRTKVPTDPDRGWMWIEADGQPAGYVHGGPVTRHPTTFWHCDSAGDTETRLRLMRQVARELGCDTVFFDRQPLRGPLGRHLRRLNSTMRTEFRQSGGWLIKIINPRSALEKLCPELSERLQRSNLSFWSGDFLITTEGESIMLRIDKGHVSVIDGNISPHAVVGGAEIAMLLIGTYAPEEIVESAKLQLRGDANDLLRVLFPAQDPQMCNEDL